MLAHYRDLWADFRAIYHLSPAEALELSGPEYMALAWRAPAYPGALAARAQQDSPSGTMTASGNGRQEKVVPLGGIRTLGPDVPGGAALGDLFD